MPAMVTKRTASTAKGRATRADSPSSSYSDREPESEGDDYVAEKSNRNGKTATNRKRKADADGASHSKKNKGKPLALSIDVLQPGVTSLRPAAPPLRRHAASYHRPLLLDCSATSAMTGRAARDALLQWFDRISTERKMPWRKCWIDPAEYDGQGPALEEALKKRAYEVWISEIMLQQTRVSTVIDYWNRWMARWPTIHDLASANPEDVLSAWRGLGYYSRASRIHAAAQKVVNDPARNGLLPRHVDELQKEVPGVGRYTAGAISSIVFGEPAPMLDGNVVRVLSRQLGIYADTKSSKHVVDSLWTAAEQLVGAVAGDADVNSSTNGPSDRPGRWGQALMELGSTVCTPKPSCGQCPVRESCRAYGEGEALALRQGALKGTQAIHSHQFTDASAADIDDVEDLCKICEPLEVVEDEALVKADIEEEEDGESGTAPTKSNGSKRAANQLSNGKKKEGKQMSLASFSFTANAKEAQGPAKEKSGPKAPSQRALDIIEAHVRQFPMRVAKKAIRQEEAIVIALRRRRRSSPSHGGTLHGWEWKLHQRPPKGLLADMWEMPSKTIDEPGERAKTAAQRKTLALDFVDELKRRGVVAKLKREMGSVPWVFSHLKLTMHVFLVEMDGEEGEEKEEKEEEGEESSTERKRKRWASTAQVEGENMGTGMRHCWALVKGVD